MMTLISRLSLRHVAFVCLFFYASLFLVACGKKGSPVPSDDSQAFLWESVTATSYNGCISFVGSLQGKYQNLTKVRLELDPVTGPEDCLGCPFSPREIVLFTPTDVGINPETGDFSFTYCPTKAEVFRWRLAGINRFSSLPHALTPEAMLFMNSNQ